jgi:hypothetical protein
MKKYKEQLLDGFKKRNFKFLKIEGEHKKLHWWLKDKWILKSSLNDQDIIINFIIDKSWEGGTKIVDEVLVTESEMSSYNDLTTKIISLDMTKKKFDIKLKIFWKEFDEFIKNLKD